MKAIRYHRLDRRGRRTGISLTAEQLASLKGRTLADVLKHETIATGTGQTWRREAKP